MKRSAMVAVLIFAIAGAARAEVAQHLPFVGRLADADGQPIDGTLPMTFAFYGGAAGGAPLWSQAYSVSLQKGRFAVNIGADTNAIGEPPSTRSELLSPELFSGPAFLEIQVGVDLPMSPRIELGAHAFALRSASAESVDCAGCISGANIADGAVSGADVSFPFAASDIKGGAATDVGCSGCISPDEVDFDYAAGAGKGGAATDLGCSGCVSTGEVDFDYAAGASKGGAAADLACTACVAPAEVTFSYAAGASKGGAASNLACTNCVAPAEVTFNYAASASKGGAASNLACTGCVSAAEIVDGPGSGLAPDTILCQKSGTTTGTAGAYSFAFTAANCGGTLPNATYVGVGTRVEVCGGLVTWRVLQAGDAGGPGMTGYSANGPCGGYNLGALYIKR